MYVMSFYDMHRAVHLFACPQMRAKTRFSQKLSSLELWSLLMTYRKSYMHGLFKEPITGPLKFNMAEIRHVENREIAMSRPHAI